MKGLFVVCTQEIWEQKIEVMALSEEDARMKVLEGYGEKVDGPDGFTSVKIYEPCNWEVYEKSTLIETKIEENLKCKSHHTYLQE